ncbi:hypothetical protein G6F56_010877 [Rhizopus delemar]|uniref:Nucleotide-diphospho-sugar transferase n=1 Tax=Rhizopus stolonifer TaxID=4846 RepID=A0A367J871_RHIST|nr:hypothetical protein G6F56_010877 [Rhizopus delemar]RCH86137.1 hypothetical protein CU098_004558 [Rhizopus stolonifer]
MVTIFKAAWVIVITSSNDYIKGVVAMKYALHNIQKSKYPLLILYTSHVLPEIVSILESIGCLVKKIDSIQPGGKVEYKAQRFIETWTKLAAWNEIDYDRLVLLDADMLPLQNMDELIEMELPRDWVAASYACTCNPQKIEHYPPHWIPENCAFTGRQNTRPPPISKKANYFNSGLIVLSPQKKIFNEMIAYLNNVEDLNIYPFPDQDFLNEIFKDKWKPISYAYNALKTLQWAHKLMWDIDSVKNLHYILTKPWDITGDQEISGLESHYKPLYEFWWKTYSELGEFVDLKRLDKILNPS